MSILEKIVMLEKQASEFGFKWENTDQIIAQIHSECDEVTSQLQDTTQENHKIKLQEEIGDLLHAVCSLCVFCGFSPLTTLEDAAIKFEQRLEAVKQLANEQGLTTLENHSFDELMAYWRKAKEVVTSPFSCFLDKTSD